VGAGMLALSGVVDASGFDSDAWRLFGKGANEHTVKISCLRLLSKSIVASCAAKSVSSVEQYCCAERNRRRKFA